MKVVFCFLIVIMIGCAQKVNLKIYDLKKIKRIKVNIDGILNESDWQQAFVENRFSFPWENRNVPRTEFRSLYDDIYLYFSFYVHDDDIVLEEKNDDATVVTREDRVELFFARDTDLKNYYCIEIDPLGRILSYSASYYRKFDESWNLKGLTTACSIFEKGYSVEGAIPLKTLQSLDLFVGDQKNELITGIFRADFSHASDGGIEEHWISWINPGGKTPDFHVPIAFGRFRFLEDR